MAISPCLHRLDCFEECGPGRGTDGLWYPPLLCHICPEPCLSASPPSNWQHPAFACPLRCPWDQPPLSRPTSPSQACYHPPWLLPVSRLAAPPQVLHPAAKVQVSFPAGLCPTHLKISITNKQCQLFNKAFRDLLPLTTCFFHLGSSKDVL